MEFDLYNDIRIRTEGEIYIGVVGPVRTGKSTFIKRFMELFVIPNIENPNVRSRSMDELPQSAAGNQVMTTEPKFVPREAAEIELEEGCSFKVRLVDCVGYMVPGAEGYLNGENNRMVQTPWFQEEVSFLEAAEYGTNKVIQEHSTIGVIVTTDGSFGTIPREEYLEAEHQAIQGMESNGKPFAILLNTNRPKDKETLNLCKEMEKEYHYPVIPINCLELDKNDIYTILHTILLEFPVGKINYFIPKWCLMLEKNNNIREDIMREAKQLLTRFSCMRQVYEWKEVPHDWSECISNILIQEIHPESGVIDIRFELKESYYYDYISDISRTPVKNECELITTLRRLSGIKEEYVRIKDALDSVEQSGYGVVLPELYDFKVDEPELTCHGGKYGVKMHASAPSVHMIKTNIETEIAPIVGSEEQANDLIQYINASKNEEQGLWNANIFGKSVGELLEEGMREKLQSMDSECQTNIQESMQKIANDNNGGMICIII